MLERTEASGANGFAIVFSGSETRDELHIGGNGIQGAAGTCRDEADEI